MLYNNHRTVVDPSVLFLCVLKSALEANSVNIPTQSSTPMSVVYIRDRYVHIYL